MSYKPHAKRMGRRLSAAIARSALQIANAANLLAALVCAVLIAATTAAMLAYQFGVAIDWLDDVLRLLLVWLVYLGSVSLSLHRDHISMDAIHARMPHRARKTVNVSTALLGISLCGLTAHIGYDSMRQAFQYGETLPSGDLPSWAQDLAIPVCFGLMSVAYLSNLFSVIYSEQQRGEG